MYSSNIEMKCLWAGRGATQASDHRVRSAVTSITAADTRASTALAGAT
jgi:hypothetical protein